MEFLLIIYYRWAVYFYSSFSFAMLINGQKLCYYLSPTFALLRYLISFSYWPRHDCAAYQRAQRCYLRFIVAVGHADFAAARVAITVGHRFCSARGDFTLARCCRRRRSPIKPWAAHHDASHIYAYIFSRYALLHIYNAKSFHARCFSLAGLPTKRRSTFHHCFPARTMPPRRHAAHLIEERFYFCLYIARNFQRWFYFAIYLSDTQDIDVDATNTVFHCYFCHKYFYSSRPINRSLIDMRAWWCQVNI